MNLVLNTKVLKKFGLSTEDLCLLIYCNKNILPRKFVTNNKEIEKLWDYGFLDRSKKGFKLNKARLLRVIITMRESSNNITQRAASLAPKLMELFPEGKKPGTSLYWRGNRMEISNKLKKFLSVYGEDFSDEQIIKATSNYVKSFNGFYSYMRVLKYFIWKNILRIGETANSVEEVSDLLTSLESEGLEQINREDWEATLI